MNFISDYFNSLFEIICVYIICYAFIYKPLPKGKLLKSFACAALLSCIIAAFSMLSKNPTLIWLINCMLIYFFIVICFHTTILETFLLYSLSFVVLLGIQFIIFAFTNAINLKLSANTSEIIYNFMTLGTAFILAKFFSLNSFYQIILKQKFAKIIFIDGFLIFQFIRLYALLMPSDFKQYFALIFIPISLLMIMDIYFLNIEQTYIQQQKELDAYQKYLPIVEDLIDHVRSRQHDYDNELLAIRMLPVTHKDYDSLTSAMDNYMLYLTSTNYNIQLLKLNLHLVAGFLFSKTYQAKEQKSN